MAINRRLFLKSGYAATLSALSPGLATARYSNRCGAGSGDYRAAVCIYLDGGNDGSNCFVPLDDVGYQGYTTSRGELHCRLTVCYRCSLLVARQRMDFIVNSLD